MFAQHERILTGASLHATMTVGRVTAEGNGVFREAESEERRRQTSALTGRSIIPNELLGINFLPSLREWLG